MELKNYLVPMSSDERDAYAKKCDVTAGHLQNVVYGLRPCTEKLAVALEQYSTAGAVDVETNCPGTRWVRLKDKTWPNPAGRPFADAAAKQEA